MFVAILDFLAPSQLFVVVVFNTQRLADVVDHFLIRSWVVALRALHRR